MLYLVTFQLLPQAQNFMNVATNFNGLVATLFTTPILRFFFKNKMNVTSRYFNYFCNIYQYYEGKLNSFLKNYLGETDPRTSRWPFTRSPIPLLIIFILYYIIAFFGPKVMKSRKPFEIRKILMIYNIGQIWLSTFIMKEITISSYQVGFSLTCQPVDMSMDPVAVRMASSSWWYHISKYVDLLDTVFFVLRKKGNQLSFLHLFHHSTMLFNSYLGMLYLPGGQAIVSTFLNSFVHVIMYWYYLLSAVGPRFHRYLWWKKYLTILQLTQFFTVLAHVFVGSVSGCEVPRWLKFYVIFYVSVLIVLFLNFYLSSYNKTSLLNAMLGVCFQNHFKKSSSEFNTDNEFDFEKDKISETSNEKKSIDAGKKGFKSKSPFTIVNRNSVHDISEENLGDSVLDKNKDI